MAEHHARSGTAWSALVRVLHGRSENMIKNRCAPERLSGCRRRFSPARMHAAAQCFFAGG